jgi:large subunit ribosomal protein L17
MRHRAKVATFGRKQGPRVALLRGLVNSLVEHGRIKTTLAKAKELRRHVERAVTVSKRGTDKETSLHATRILMSRYPNENTVTTLMKDIAPRFKTREGGYTRILKLGMRPGDRAEMALIEFVDYKPSAKPEVDAAEVKATARRAVRATALKRKHLRTIQKDSRKVARTNTSNC